MVHGVKEQLAGFRENMRDMHDGIAEMADQVRTELHDFSTDLRTGGSIFRKESSPKMSHKASSHKMVHKASKPRTNHKAKAKKHR